jgi:hypothetical protein
LWEKLQKNKNKFFTDGEFFVERRLVFLESDQIPNASDEEIQKAIDQNQVETPEQRIDDSQIASDNYFENNVAEHKSKMTKVAQQLYLRSKVGSTAQKIGMTLQGRLPSAESRVHELDRKVREETGKYSGFFKQKVTDGIAGINSEAKRVQNRKREIELTLEELNLMKTDLENKLQNTAAKKKNTEKAKDQFKTLRARRAETPGGLIFNTKQRLGATASRFGDAGAAAKNVVKKAAGATAEGFRATGRWAFSGMKEKDFGNHASERALKAVKTLIKKYEGKEKSLADKLEKTVLKDNEKIHDLSTTLGVEPEKFRGYFTEFLQLQKENPTLLSEKNQEKTLREFLWKL